MVYFLSKYNHPAFLSFFVVFCRLIRVEKVRFKLYNGNKCK